MKSLKQLLIRGRLLQAYLVTPTQRLQEGQALGTFFGPVWLGVENGADVFKNQNPAGQVNEDQWEDIGNAMPFAIVGWSNDFTYKNWSLNVNFRAGIGGKVLNLYRLYYESWTRMGLTNIVHTQYENPEFTGGHCLFVQVCGGCNVS
jgi:hypothetical protein